MSNRKVGVEKSNALTLFNPSYIDDYGFTPEEFRVFARIMRRSCGEQQMCFESVASMSKDLLMSERLVRESLQILVRCKVIQMEGRKGRTPIIRFNSCEKWMPKVQLLMSRHEVAGNRKERDRQRKMTPGGNATPSGNATPTPVGNARGTPGGNATLRYSLLRVSPEGSETKEVRTQTIALSPKEKKEEESMLMPVTPAAKELDRWMDAIAPLLGSRTPSTMADEKKWNLVCQKAISNNFTLEEMIEAIESEKKRLGKQVQYFSADSVLKLMQLRKAQPTFKRFDH